MRKASRTIDDRSAREARVIAYRDSYTDLRDYRVAAWTPSAPLRWPWVLVLLGLTAGLVGLFAGTWQ